ncbi:MAG: GNAT family N-acetyltransferase [Oscillospiraceae bacterium]|nr:GNAT family N-acetyltransferase [Oscillospiraceae bacterium]
MLGNLRGNQSHQEDNLRWLTGDINHTYFSREIEVDAVIKRMKDGEIPDNLYFFTDEPEPEPAASLLASGMFKENMATIGMAHELCDTILPKPDGRVNLFRVREISQLKVTGAILNAVFAYRMFSFDRFVEMFEGNGQYFYIAEYDGLPVSAIMTLHGDDFMDLSWAGTLPGYRKLGLAGSLIQMAERDALLSGKTIGVLRAYPAIAGSYRRIGYREYCRGIGMELIKA